MIACYLLVITRLLCQTFDVFCVDKEWGTGLVVKSIRIHVCDLPQTDVQWMEMLKHISPNLPQEKCILILHTSLICTNRLNINNQFALMGLMNYSHDVGFDKFECFPLMSWFDLSLMCGSFCIAFQAPVENFWVTAWAGLTIKKTTRIPPKSGPQKTLDLSRDLNFRFPDAKDYFIDLFCFCLSQSISYIRCTKWFCI